MTTPGALGYIVVMADGSPLGNGPIKAGHGTSVILFRTREDAAAWADVYPDAICLPLVRFAKRRKKPHEYGMTDTRPER